VTTDDVNALGARLVAADADGGAEGFHDTAYTLLAGLGEEHARADGLAARIQTLAGRERRDRS
jgi:hypothetical protein